MCLSETTFNDLNVTAANLSPKPLLQIGLDSRTPMIHTEHQISVTWYLESQTERLDKSYDTW